MIPLTSKQTAMRGVHRPVNVWWAMTHHPRRALATAPRPAGFRQRAALPQRADHRTGGVHHHFSVHGVSQEHLRTIRKIWTGPLVVKGVQHPQDALDAMHLGADGLVLSNHGGRQSAGADGLARNIERGPRACCSAKRHAGEGLHRKGFVFPIVAASAERR